MEIAAAVEFPNLFSGDIRIERIAFNIFGIDIYWYGILIALGVILGFIYAMKRSKGVGLISDDVFDVAFWGAIGGFVGARAYYCIFYNLSPENENKYTFITAITGIHDGGLAIYGGIIGAVIVGIIVTKIKKVPFLPILDLAGPGFLIGQAIGRWGNFVNQEAFGAPTAGNLPWGMTGTIIANNKEVIAAQEALGTDGYALVHPCFLYESLWCALGLLLIYLFSKKFRSFDGELALLYVVWYGTGRGIIEGLRTDSLYFYIGDNALRVSQVLGFSSAILALFLLIYFKLTLKRKESYLMYCNTERSKALLDEYESKIQLERETRNAKRELKRAERESNNVAPSILGDNAGIEDEVKIESQTEGVKTEDKKDGDNN